MLGVVTVLAAWRVVRAAVRAAVIVKSIALKKANFYNYLLEVKKAFVLCLTITIANIAFSV